VACMPELGSVPAGLRGLLLGELPGIAGSIDRENRVPDGFLERLREEGAFDLGSPASLLEAVRLASRSSPAVGHLILIHGTAWCRVRGLVGEPGIVAVSITEPGGGTDVLGNLETRAEPGGGGRYLVSGVKVFTSNALYARYFLVLARGPGGPTLYLAERSDSIMVEPLDLTTLRGAGVARVEYRAAEAVEAGTPGKGLREALEAINLGRLGYAAIGLGIAEGALEAAVRWSLEHKVFGKPLADYQGPRWMLAEVALEARALEALIREAASEASDCRVDPLKAAMAKVLGARLAQRASWIATQLMGGRGLSRWSLTERLSRDSRALDIGEGAREVLLDFIASRVLKGG